MERSERVASLLGILAQCVADALLVEQARAVNADPLVALALDPLL